MAKRKRNEQWEAAFADLREEISQPPEIDDIPNDGGFEEVESIGKSFFKPVEDIFPNGVDWDRIYSVAGMELVDDGVFRRRLSRMQVEDFSESFWNLLRFDSRLPGAPSPEWPANTGRPLTRHYLPPQSLWAPEHMRWTAIRRRQTTKKLATQGLSVGLLIHALLDHVNMSQVSPDALKSLSPYIQDVARLDKSMKRNAWCEIRDIKYRITMIPAEDTRLIETEMINAHASGIPQYHQDGDGDFYHITEQMNTAIRTLLQKCKHPDQIALTTAKLCHNLLVSSAAPDVQTFNALIFAFGKWRRPRLIDDVIVALKNCHIRPNEITCAAVLNHYVQTNRPDEFSKYVARMRGINQALMLARPDVIISDASQGRLVRRSETKVYQKVHATPMVFNSLMLGVLKFAGFERAVDIYCELKEDGWGLDIPGLCHFLDDCIRRGDWQGGLFVWTEIDSIKAKAKRDNMLEAYTKMLGLCLVTGKTVGFERMLREAVRAGFDRKSLTRQARVLEDKAHMMPDPQLAPDLAADLVVNVSDYLSDPTEAEPPDSWDKPNKASVANTPSTEGRGTPAPDPKSAPLETSSTPKIPLTNPHRASGTDPWGRSLNVALSAPQAPLATRPRSASNRSAEVRPLWMKVQLSPMLNEPLS